MIDGIGLAKFVETADRLAATYGDRFKVPQLLRDTRKLLADEWAAQDGKAQQP